MSSIAVTTKTACEEYNVEFEKSGVFWESKINGEVVLTYKQEGACRRNTEKFLTAHDGYYARLYKKAKTPCNP